MNHVIELSLLTASGTAAYIESYFDAKNIKKNKSIEHLISATLRVVFSFGLSYFLLTGTIYPSLIAMSMLGVYSLVFDSAINIRLGRSVYYLGKTAWTDRLARSMNADGVTWAAFKGVIIIALLTIARYVN